MYYYSITINQWQIWLLHNGYGNKKRKKGTLLNKVLNLKTSLCNDRFDKGGGEKISNLNIKPEPPDK